MNPELKRIFISDLPETATQDAIQNAFENYGEVSSVEIKERKELGVKNTSLFFAYININTDPKRLNNCFNDFSKAKWLGQQVILQLARESFLERLKRERANQNSSKNESHVKTTEIITKIKPISDNKINKISEKLVNGSSKFVPKKLVSSESSSSSSESEQESKSKIKEKNKNFNLLNEITEPDPDLIIKNNRGKTQVSKVLKIESVGKEPIIKIEKQKKNVSINNSEANLKRLESLKSLKQGYQNKKSLIQAALSNVDSQPKNKIIFDDASEKVYNKQKTNIKQKDIVNDKTTSTFLFNDSESEEEEREPTFSVKEHFQGKEGQKLLELQSKYKNDKRFTLDKRFLDNENIEKVGKKQQGNDSISNEDISMEEEKNKEYEILEEILGKKILRKADRETSSKKKAMLRFDPAQPEHLKYEIPKPLPEKKEKKRKRKNSETEMIEEKKAQETTAPNVSKEIFFKVSDDLKETFEEKKEFSLLSMFGRHEEKDEQVAEEAVETASRLNNKFHQEKNPFKYDSSDDEDETGHIPSKDNMANTEIVVSNNSRQQETVRKPTTWTDPFFFRPDDYRLQEGFDFVTRIGSEEKMEFTKLRRDLKGIVKAKVRNNLRKNKPFKKKLGGNKKKKILRMKKAMKR